MNDQQQELTQDELESQDGAVLPTREVMSVVSQNPGLIAIPEDPYLVPLDPDPDTV